MLKHEIGAPQDLMSCLRTVRAADLTLQAVSILFDVLKAQAKRRGTALLLNNTCDNLDSTSPYQRSTTDNHVENLLQVRGI